MKDYMGEYRTGHTYQTKLAVRMATEDGEYEILPPETKFVVYEINPYIAIKDQCIIWVWGKKLYTSRHYDIGIVRRLS